MMVGEYFVAIFPVDAGRRCKHKGIQEGVQGIAAMM